MIFPIIMLIAVLIGAFLFFFGISFYLTGNSYGWIATVVGILMIIIPSILFAVNKRKKDKNAKEEEIRIAKEKEESFKDYLLQQSFSITDRAGELLIDSSNKKWCINFKLKIFDFRDIAKVKINKHRSSRTETLGSSSGSASRSSTSRRGYFITTSRSGNSSSHRSRSGHSTRISEDTSTYEVLIQTSLIDYPLVIIDCDRSLTDAEKICALIKIMKDKAKTNE